MSRIYIAGPMRSYPQFNFPAFDECAETLRARGHEVRSPAEHDRENGFDETAESLDGFDMAAALRWDIESVLWADGVALLPGWEYSDGCRIELTVAKATDIQIYAYRRGRVWCLAGLTYEEVNRRLAEPKPEPERPDTILDEAKTLVTGARQAAYGHPIHDFERTAAIWAPILGVAVSPEQVALCMIGVKVSRLVNTPTHHDSVVDIAGYAETLHMVQQARR